MMTQSEQSNTPLILASASPRRRELLTGLGVEFKVLPADIDETVQVNELPHAYVQRMAVEKARAGLARAAVEYPDAQLALGADTTVVMGEQILGKPKDAADAARMLMLLSGATHQVMSAVAVTDGTRLATRLSVSAVSFRPLQAAEIAAYWATGEPADKAGAYAIQGLAAVFISNLQGSYSGVVGLPVFETAELLAEFGCPSSLDQA